MNFYKYRNNDRCKCVPMFCWLRGFTSIAYVVPKSWLLNTIFQWKKLMLLGEMVDSKAGAGKVQDEPRTFFFRAESKEAKRMMRHAKKMPESSLKSSHLSIEINHENKALQLSLEQCRFELCGFTYTWIFFSIDLLISNPSCSMVNWRLGACIFGRLTYYTQSFDCMGDRQP